MFLEGQEWTWLSRGIQVGLWWGGAGEQAKSRDGFGWVGSEGRLQSRHFVENLADAASMLKGLDQA